MTYVVDTRDKRDMNRRGHNNEVQEEYVEESYAAEPLERQDSYAKKLHNKKIVSIRLLASVVLLLLASSQLLLLGEKALPSSHTKIIRWKVNTKENKLTVFNRPSKTSKAVHYLEPGEIAESYGEGTKYYLHIISPVTGYAHRKSPETGKEFFIHIDNGERPIQAFDEGWWPDSGKPLAKYRYAPTAIVIAQQLWNAMQVVQLYLLICLCYTHFQSSKKSNAAVPALAVISLILLPFSLYVTSPGGDMFAIITLLTSVVGIKGKHKYIELSMDKFRPPAHSELNSDEPTSRKDPFSLPAVWLLVREESLAFICNVCSSLYNYNSSRSTFPYWNSGFRSIDHFFGLTGGVPGSKLDCTLNWLYTLGSDIQIPLFVPRAVGSTIGSFQLAMLWAVIPFFYVSYFACMYAMSKHSPAPRVQRMLALFGIFHFLFLTDIVTYKYGRGMRTPHTEVFHWFERIAWRIAILLPVYQNCTSGHWKRGHSNPIIGKFLHYFMVGWSTMFFIQQVLLSDLFLFFQFLKGWEEKTALMMLGVGHLKLLSYHIGLVISWLVYGYILLVRFWNYGIFLRLKGQPSVSTSSKMYHRAAMVMKASVLLIIIAAFFCCICRFITTHHYQDDHAVHLDKESSDE